MGVTLYGQWMQPDRAVDHRRATADWLRAVAAPTLHPRTLWPALLGADRRVPAVPVVVGWWSDAEILRLVAGLPAWAVRDALRRASALGLVEPVPGGWRVRLETLAEAVERGERVERGEQVDLPRRVVEALLRSGLPVRSAADWCPVDDWPVDHPLGPLVLPDAALRAIGACTRDWGVGRPLVPTGRLRPSPETVALQDATRALGPLGDHLIAAWQRSLWRALLGRPPEPVLDGLDDPCRAVVAARPLDPLGLPAVADALRAGVPLGPWLDAARRAARIVLGGAGRPVDGRLGWGPLPR